MVAKASEHFKDIDCSATVSTVNLRRLPGLVRTAAEFQSSLLNITMHPRRTHGLFRHKKWKITDKYLILTV